MGPYANTHGYAVLKFATLPACLRVGGIVQVWQEFWIAGDTHGRGNTTVQSCNLWRHMPRTACTDSLLAACVVTLFTQWCKAWK